MRSAAFAAVLALAAVPSRAQLPEKKGHAPDPGQVCSQDVKDDKTLIAQGFFWMKDTRTVERMTGKLVAHLVCKAKDEKAKDPCQAIDKMQPAFKYDKEIGTQIARCQFLNSYADFWWELMTADKKQRKFPACAAHLDTLRAPVKFFDLSGTLPANLRDPGNDGGFWNVCRWISDAMQKGVTGSYCDPRTKYWLSKEVPEALWKTYCDAAAQLWVDGDEKFCDLQKPDDELCRSEAALTRSFKARSYAACPPTGVERGLCLNKLSERPGSGCSLAWSDLKDSYCTERSQIKPEDMPKKKSGTKGAGGR
ncbi:hypothetical protein EPO15_18455 [bacterium]|nr:MAG: hypothetical protein EPO15_18455 [bacterium]